jgi:hypothetical protein
MYDVLRATYEFHCPTAGDDVLVRVPLSAFRRLERLPGAAHPAVYRVEYDCRCGAVHAGLVSHEDLDYGPLVPVQTAFRNLLTGRTEPVGDELAEVYRAYLQRGNWPWRLYCTAEGCMKPVFPSCLEVVLPHAHDQLMGVAMRCPSCGATTVNLVSEPHLDVPFFHDPVVHYLERPFDDPGRLTLDEFRSELHSQRFEAA